MSTIFTPAAAIGVRYAEAEQAALRRGHDWMLGHTLRDQSLLNSTHQYGKRAGLATHNPRGGYVRDTADSRPISEARGREITTYRQGRWGGAGGGTQRMVHDLTDSLRSS